MNTHDNQYRQTLVDTTGLKLASRLNDAAEVLPHDITERLRFARQQALDKRKTLLVVQTASASETISNGGGTAAISGFGGHSIWWNRIFSVLPLIALLAGLNFVSHFQDQVRAEEVASVDSELLTGELPPDAYANSAFVQYLRINAQK